ncbi:hypothetical protein ATCC90586_007144 [Pythium insidiosum]|nr:hypothetical protein ATCC90586_007144 [Pythium insidiosum]
MASASASASGAASAGAPPQVYSFPLLKPAELIACIREMQIPVSEDELRNCDVAAIRKVLEVFIETTMGVSREEMNQPQFAGLSVLSYPELHEDSIPELTFFRQASKLMQACGIYDFSMKDVLTPNPKRVRRQLSALINFAKFRDERVAAFAELTKETDVLLKQKATLQDENEALQRQLQELLSEQAAEEPAIRQITDENAALEGEINVLNKRQAVMRHENNELKTKYQELKDEMSSLQFNVLEADRQISELQGKIVNSPDRVKAEISSIALSLEDAKEEMNAMERRLRELQMYSDTFARTEKDMLKTIDLMDEIEGDMKKCKDAKEQVKLQRKEIDDNRRQALEIISQRKRLEKLVEQKREQFERYKDEAKLKDEAAEHALHAAQDELAQLETTHQDARQRIASTRDAARDVERRMREDELRFQAELYELQQMYSRLNLAAQMYNTQLTEALRAATSDTS